MVHRQRQRLSLARAAALLAALGLAGCAALVAPSAPATAGAEVIACARWFEQLDAAIDRAGVRDVEAERIAGFAGLRVDRVAEALRDQARADAGTFEAWLARLQKLENEGRAVEISNLPRDAFALAEVSDVTDAAAARSRSAACTAYWRAPLQADAALRMRLLDAATVPDRYATWQRAVGLYPLVRWPFFAGVENWQREHQAQVERWDAAPPAMQRFVPTGVTPTAAHVAGLWRHRPRDPLGLPQFLPDEAATLLAAHAPVVEIDDRGAFDRFGALVWRDGGAAPGVDTATPVLYQRLAATRYRGQWLMQLVYTLWFPERPPRSRFDLLAGALDALVVRITLAPDDGRPLLVDTIHGCGCYHLFLPTPEVRLRDDAPTDVEWAFSPITLPTPQAGQRFIIRLDSASHYVVGATLDNGRPGAPYDLRSESALRSLSMPQGGTRSVFGPDGLVPGSERAERFLFWPMGIASAGAMRQWGHHATAFVGRRHFDDADLIEARFVISRLESR